MSSQSTYIGAYPAASPLTGDQIPDNLIVEDMIATGAVTAQKIATPAIAASVAGNALTISLKRSNGNDPSVANPVVIPFRSVTDTDGLPSFLTVSAPTSLVVSSGSTLGTTNGLAERLWVVGFNDGGTFRLGVVNCVGATNKDIFRLRDDASASSTAEGGAGAADSAHVIYTGAAVTTKPMVVLGYIEITEATAGTWATAPTKVQSARPGMPLPGDVVTEAIHLHGVQETTTSGSDTDTSLLKAINLKDACNVVEVRGETGGRVVSTGNSVVAQGIFRLKRSTTTLSSVILETQGNGTNATTWSNGSSAILTARERVPAVGSTTYRVTMVNSGGASTIYAQYGGTNGRIEIRELMA